MRISCLKLLVTGEAISMHHISWTFKCRVRLAPSLFLRHRGGCSVAWNTQGEKREYDEKNKKKIMLSM